MNSFEIIYDFASIDGFKKFQILLIPVGIFLFLKFILFLIENDEEENLFKDPEHQKFIVKIIQYLSILLFFLFSILFGYGYYKTNDLYHNAKFQTEGFVTNFHPMPSGGHEDETFTVNGVKFEFSDFDISGFGYNNSKSHGGAIDANKYVRISYIRIKNSNQILKLEVRK
ncbi:hypothetical protein [Flavobacterium johnsoniae]|uniref:Uncharacterized protein n=1 Tax=Flavobacterium johnsoniae TaxID=986 RepID=A0A1J7C6D4_FLAJO|nr:hypothetical protein [Flavobacterium johnsoniae]OIV41241.1 hypothetical protein BKM63_11870 [Flavobacterium johnsoniae]